MAPVLDGDAEYLADASKKIARDASGALIPTKESQALLRFDYIIRRPMVSQRLLHLELGDLKLGPLAKGGKAGKPWRRGLGCSKLVLAENASGRLGTKISQVAGNVVIKFRQPTKYRAMPTLTLRFFCFTMDANGHIEWPTNFSNTSRQLLRKLARRNLEQMLKDPEYPVDPSMRCALTQSSSSVLQLRSSPTDPPE